MNTTRDHNNKIAQPKLSKKLILAKETICELTDLDLRNAVGGKVGLLKSHLSNCPFNCADTIGCDPIP